MNILGFHFHSFVPVWVESTKWFFGEKYRDFDETRYRICKECGVVQEYFFDSQGGTWSKLDPKRQEIIKKHVYWEAAIDKYLVDKDPSKPPKGWKPPAGRPKPSEQEPNKQGSSLPPGL